MTTMYFADYTSNLISKSGLGQRIVDAIDGIIKVIVNAIFWSVPV